MRLLGTIWRRTARFTDEKALEFTATYVGVIRACCTKVKRGCVRGNGKEWSDTSDGCLEDDADVSTNPC